MNHQKSLSYCKANNSVILMPKTLTERNAIKLINSTVYYWTNSKIMNIGEPFVWTDGSRVHGFRTNEPNNYNNLYSLVENAVGFVNGYFNDLNETANRSLVCQFPN